MRYGETRLNYALGYFMVIPGTNKIYIHKDCPKDIKERLEKYWQEIVEETEARRAEMAKQRIYILSSADFY